MNIDPSICFSQSPFGFGPFPVQGGTLACVPHPPGAGYGGVGYGLHTGGTGYGLAGYGGTAHWPASPMAIEGGYGGDPYGLGPYGSTDRVPPQISSALSISDWEIEVFFTEGMMPGDPSLVDPSNYTLVPVTGAAPSTVESVAVGTVGTVDVVNDDYVAEVTSVILRHSGTTLGGTYTLRGEGPVDLAGNPMAPSEVSLLARGGAPPHSIQPTAGDKLLVTWEQPMLLPAEYPATPSDNPRLTIEDVAEWAFEDDRGVTPVYPIPLTVQSIDFPFNGNATQAEVTTLGQTSILYRSRISPSFITDWSAADGDPTSAASADYSATITDLTGAISGSAYRLTATPGVGFGSLNFQDLTGKADAGATLRLDASFQVVGYTPPVADVQNMFGLAYQEDSVDIQLWCGYDGVLDQPTLWVWSSGAFAIKVTGYDWTTGAHTVSIVLNQKSGKAVWLFDGHPIYATDLGNLNAGPALGYGLAAVNSERATLTGDLILDITQIQWTASSTVYSGAWNFLHEETAQFTGSNALARSWLRTHRGPLVKGHGDGTPATKQDVTVEVNGIEVEVSKVNPYIGRVELAVPIPRMPPGTLEVEVDYQWMASPRMYMQGLNTKGVVLNKYDNSTGRNNLPGRGQESQNLPNHPKGSAPTQRYPYTILLGPPKSRPTPKLIGHRYMGFERGYSALLNSATTLRLNSHPHRYQVAGFTHASASTSVAFDGSTDPQRAREPWALFGSDTGHQNPAEGTYTVIDAVAGNPDPGNEPLALYHRDIDISFPASVFVVSRFVVPDVGASDGVYTGISFGLHDDVNLYLVGALQVNGLEHVGLVLNPDKPHLVESWQIGPQATLTVNAGQDTCTAATSEIPQDLTVGDRFQVLEGAQAGTYTLTDVIRQTDGTSTLTVEPQFPAFHDLWGNKFPVAIFETKWSGKPATYRLTVNPRAQVAVLQMSGGRTSTITHIDGTVPALLAAPSETSLLLPPATTEEAGVGTRGSVFFGSASRQASNQVEWSFFRYGVVPDSASVRGHVQAVATDFSQYLPDENPNDFGWYRANSFGDGFLSLGSLVIKSTSNLASAGPKEGYGRHEAFLTTQAGLDLRANWRVESGSTAGGQIILNNGQRQALYANLLYTEQGSQRQLVEMPVVGMTGMVDPTSQGWVDTSNSDLTKTFYQQAFQTTGEGGWLGQMVGDLTNASAGRIFEMEIRVPSHTANANGDTGIEMTGEVGDGPFRAVTLALRGGGTKGVRLISGTTIIGQFDFSWDDGGKHFFRCVADTATMTLLTYVDDTLRSTLDLALFTHAASGNQYMSLGSFGTDINGADDAAISATVEWRSASMQALPAAHVKRTMGVALRPLDDITGINDWAIPRTDNTNLPNSNLTAVVVEWDWRSDMETRLVLDPLWGVSVLRPDLALPAGYLPEDETTPATGFHTRKAEPSAAWLNVEYGRLPKVSERFGTVLFGNLSGDVAQSRWASLSYEIYRHWKDDLKQPEGMVLNRFNVISSSELGKDKAMEVVETETLDGRRLTLKPFHIYASRVYKVVDGTTVFTDESYEFDRASQTLTLVPDGDGNPRTFSADHALVSVVFVPGKPVTETYLKSQSLLQSLTKLNEGTPPYPKSQVASTEKRVAVGNDLRGLDDPDVTQAVNILGDADRFLDHEAPNDIGDLDTYYEQMSFFEKDNGGETGLLQFPCEATKLDGLSGWADTEGDGIYDADNNIVGQVGKPYGGFVLDFSGALFHEDATRDEPFGDLGMPGSILFAAGGEYAGPVQSVEHVYAGHVPALAGTLNSTPLHPLKHMGVQAVLITNSGQVIPLDGSLGISPSLVPVS